MGMSHRNVLIVTLETLCFSSFLNVQDLVLLSGLLRKLSCKSMITPNILVTGYGHFHCSLTLATSDTMMKCFGCGRVRHLVQDSPPKEGDESANEQGLGADQN